MVSDVAEENIDEAVLDAAMQDYDFDYGQNADEIKKQEKDANYQRLLELIDYDDDDYQDANEEVSFEETKNVESRSNEGYTDGENKELI